LSSLEVYGREQRRLEEVLSQEVHLYIPLPDAGIPSEQQIPESLLADFEKTSALSVQYLNP
jgi:hypothetical protein